MIDALGRRIDYVRISITDRCNLRCMYCMPSSGVESFAHGDILTYEEIERVVQAFARLGIKYVRLTGGEPLARKGCIGLIERIKAIDGIEAISMTTNAILLDGQVNAAHAAGLSSINISLDTLDEAAYGKITRGGELAPVLRVIEEALALGMRVKLNVVPVRKLNDASLVPLASLARDKDISVRFIELMPVGCGADLEPIEPSQIEQMMEDAFGQLTPDPSHHGYGPARYVKPNGFRGSLGFISAVSHEFCKDCNRVRLTADGRLKLCLNHQSGIDIRALLRGGITDEALTAAMREAIDKKPLRHGFLENVADREERRMNEIGG